jgi:zinc transport system substrate-binding protein
MILAAIIYILPHPSIAEVPRVVTDIPPIHALTAQVMGDLGSPVLLLARGADEHDFQLRPSQMGDIAAANLVVWAGPSLTPWLGRAMGAAKSLPLLGAEHEEHDSAAQSHAEEGHDHMGADPHAWLDPLIAAQWLDTIAASMAEMDPENAAQYQRNAALAKTDIAAMDAEITAALAPVLAKGFVTYHDAYRYFAEHYGLSYLGAVALGDATSAGAAHVQKVQDIIASGAVCVFPEAQHDSAILLQLLDGTQAKAGAALDPVGSTLEPGAAAYGALMRGISKTLVDCLAGP